MRTFTLALLFAVLVTSALLGVTAAGAQTPTASPADVARAATDALNRGDIAAWLALFTDDASIQGFPDCTVPCTGSAAIRQEITVIVGAHVHVATTSTDVSGSMVTSRFEATSDGLRALGYSRVVGTFTVTVRGDKIAFASFVLDENDPETARFLAQYSPLFRKAPPSTPAQRILPSTGSAYSERHGRGLILLSALTGIAFLVGGLALRATSGRQRRR